MELDDMKGSWLALDRRLRDQETLNLRVYKEIRSDRIRANLRGLVAGQIIQLVVGILMALLFAPFWVEHRDAPHLFVTGLVLHGYALMFIVFAARDLYLIQRIDYAAPVLDIQRQLAELRAWRIRVAPIFGAIGCLIWVPFLLWLFEVSADVDVYALHPDVVYAFVAAGFGCLAVMLLVIRWMRNPRRARFSRMLDESVAGRGIGKAQRMLDDVAAFGREA